MPVNTINNRPVLSQSSLRNYVDCPRRFELRHLLNLDWPALESPEAIELESVMRRGHEFHHLLYQHTMGIPAATLGETIEDETIRRWWQLYLRWQSTLPQERFGEIALTTGVETGPTEADTAPGAAAATNLLTAKYDLLTRLPDGTLLIVDWKTGRPPRRSLLAGRLQTVVYRYVLTRAGDWLNGGVALKPEQIRMIYWFAEDGSTIEFDYSKDEFDRDGQRIKSIVGEIAERTEFPLTDDDRKCRFCCYRSLCHREVEPPTIGEWLAAAEEVMDDPISIHLDDLEEISL